MRAERCSTSCRDCAPPNGGGSVFSYGIGRRNLELSFNRYLGLSPKQLIKQMRFTLCREDLLKSQYASVGQAAQAWGYWHMGQFGRDYKALFGELPSETLKNRASG